MMPAGTSSKWTGNGSRPRCWATAQISGMADSSSAALRSSRGIASAHLQRGAARPCHPERSKGSPEHGSAHIQRIARGEELAERRVDLVLAGDRHADEVFVLDGAEGGHQRTERPPAAFLDLAVAEDVRTLQELVHQVQAALVVHLAP